LIIWLIAFGLIFLEGVPLWSIYLLFAIGFLIMLDDAIQHIRQRKDRAYRSPLHNLYGKYLWPIPWIQALNKWFDDLLGS